MPVSGNMKNLLHISEAIIRFIRLPNLVIVAGIVFLLRWFILLPFLYGNNELLLSPAADYILFSISLVLLAAGGYIINDYFDVRIDAINHPQKQEMSRYISPRQSMNIYLIVNLLAVLTGGYLAFRVQSLWFGLLFPAGSFLFYIYSLRWKHLLVVKNLVVALVSASLIILVLLYEFFYLRLHAPGYFASHIPALRTVFHLFLYYAGFAFLTTFFREIIKDVEDLPGDKASETHSLPVVFGIKPSKWVAVGLIITMMVLLLWTQVIARRMGLSLLFWYLLMIVQLPSVYLIITLIRANNQGTYHLSATLAKLIMVTGILSMLFL